MPKILSNAIIVILVAFGVAVAYHQIFPPKMVIRDKQIHLSKEQLDSLELSVRIRVEGEIRAEVKSPIIRTVKSVEDSILAQERLDEILRLRDSLRTSGNAVLQLEYRGLVGKYRDSLHVVADFISDSISVNFSPNPRDFFVRDTIETGDSFWTDAKQIGLALGAGAAIGVILSQTK